MNDTNVDLSSWVGKKQTKTDLVTAWPVAALNATLDRKEGVPKAGDEIPPGWHWLYFLEASPAAELGPDGHPQRGGFLPPIALPRRMWAGGRLDFKRSLRIGESAQRDSEIMSVETKHGKSGDLVFVTVRHTITAGGETAVVEEHDIVYRGAAKPGETQTGKPAPHTAPWRREIASDPVLLFRFSALTFNGHRIHYDPEYCRGEEHYPGLIVHGPLQTVLILDLCRREESRPVKKLDYRALHPIFHAERFTVNGEPSGDGASAKLWTSNAAGSFAMTGTATF